MSRPQGVMGTEVLRAPGHTLTLYIAGDIAEARRVVRQWCRERGDCLSVTPTEFIYTGGEEAGVAIGRIGYPRFPKPPEEMWERMRELAPLLIEALNQRSCTIVGPDRSEMVRIDPPGVTTRRRATTR